MLEVVKKLISEELSIPLDKIKAESDIVKDLGADSLDVVELLMALEDNTGKSIPEEKVTDIKTVGDVVKLLESL